MTTTILEGDCLQTLKSLPDGSVQCVVTSPPYWGLRDYGIAGQLGMEPTPQEFVINLVAVFREVRRVLRDDGTLWLNLGDSYAGSGGAGEWSKRKAGKQEYAGPRGNNVNRIVKSKRMERGSGRWGGGNLPAVGGLKPKDLVGIPWRVAFALQEDGWWLRSDIIWQKPNPMPESVSDRPTKSHEYIFLLTKSEQYFYDADAILEDCSPNTHARISQDLANQVGSFKANGGSKSNGPMKAVIRGSTRKLAEAGSGIKQNSSFEAAVCLKVEKRNKRSVWTVPTGSYSGAHFATFPPELIEPCILAGSKPGDTVLDPFNGSGTAGEVSIKHHRNYIGCELNPEYIELTLRRLAQVQPVLPAISALTQAPADGYAASQQASLFPASLEPAEER
jgi:DNA modification methylase